MSTHTITLYRVTASAMHGDARVDATNPVVLGEDYDARYATEEGAQDAADDLDTEIDGREDILGVEYDVRAERVTVDVEVVVEDGDEPLMDLRVDVGGVSVSVGVPEYQRGTARTLGSVSGLLDVWPLSGASSLREWVDARGWAGRMAPAAILVIVRPLALAARREYLASVLA